MSLTHLASRHSAAVVSQRSARWQQHRGEFIPDLFYAEALFEEPSDELDPFWSDAIVQTIQKTRFLELINRCCNATRTGTLSYSYGVLTSSDALYAFGACGDERRWRAVKLVLRR